MSKETEAARARDEKRAALRAMAAGRAQARVLDGLPPERPEWVAPPTLTERAAEVVTKTPPLGVLLLIALPIAWPLFAFFSPNEELKHESWRFRYHDFVARHPVGGAALSFGGIALLFTLPVVALFVARELYWR